MSFLCWLARHIKHLLSVTTLLALMYLASLIKHGISGSEFSALERYGLGLSCLLYFMQLAVLASFPFAIFNFLGIVFLNVFVPRPKLQKTPLLDSYICFRVVTRGLYPNLVNENVRYNIEVCEKVGVAYYFFEVVTDKSVKLQAHSRSREIVVPDEYMTANMTLFKARALQYALEPDVNILGPSDWIVHLDEETILTEESVIGIINFVISGKHPFGQGTITYGKGAIVNWITTLADSIRVGIDYGCYRFTLRVLHKPVFSWKGSFIVANVKAEMDISFDHGPDASIAEDCFFACEAFRKGYSFDFVDGDMIEQSTFTLKDFIRQRCRWMYGILLTILSKKIPLWYKIGPLLLTVSNAIMPINFLLLPLGLVWPLPISSFLLFVYSFILGTTTYLYILGTLLTFCVKQHCRFYKCCLLLLATLPCGFLACVLENISSILVFWMPQSSLYSFYIVKKEAKAYPEKMAKEKSAISLI